MAIVFADSFNGKFIDWVGHVEDFNAPVAEHFHLRQAFNGFFVLARCVVNLLLAVFHAVDVFLDRAQFAIFRRHEEQQVLQFFDVVFTGHHAAVDADFQGFAVFSPERFIFFTVFFQIPLQRLEDGLFQVAADEAQFSALLQEFTGNVQGQVRRIDEALDKAQVIRQEVFTFIHDEDVT